MLIAVGHADTHISCYSVIIFWKSNIFILFLPISPLSSQDDDDDDIFYTYKKLCIGTRYCTNYTTYINRKRQHNRVIWHDIWHFPFSREQKIRVCTVLSPHYFPKRKLNNSWNFQLFFGMPSKKCCRPNYYYRAMLILYECTNL